MKPTATDLTSRLQRTVHSGQFTNLHSLLVFRHGEPLFEHYGTGPDFSWHIPHGVVEFGPDTLHDLRSVTKSVVGLLYGIAWGAGDAPAPEDPLLSHFPEYPDLAADPARARLTVGHALTMTLGLDWNEDAPYTSTANSEIAMEFAPDRFRYVLERPVVADPGVRWRYTGGATALVGRLITRGTGGSLREYAERVLFGPLGIDSYEWMAGPDGVPSAASGLRLTPRALARIGRLVLAGGRWEGRQVVPAGPLGALLRPRVRIHGDRHYGYQWYLLLDGDGGRRWAEAAGNGGQRLVVVPELDLVVVTTAGNYDTGDQSGTIVDSVVETVRGG